MTDHSKGRVERSIRYIRDNFFAAREFKDIGDANRQLQLWLAQMANQRPWPDDRSETVYQKWQEEKHNLIPLPINDMECSRMVTLRSGKWAFLRFDLNDYSIPSELVGKPLTLMASPAAVRILDGNREVAMHVRSYSKQERIIDGAHFKRMQDLLPASQTNTAQGEILRHLPESKRLIELMSEHGLPIKRNVEKILQFIHTFGEDTVKFAVTQAIKREIPRASYIAQLCEHAALKAGAPTVRPVTLRPEQQNLLNANVTPHDLSSYESLIDHQGEVP